MKSEIQPLAQVPQKRVASPRGRFQVHRQHLTQALGVKPDQGVQEGGHPFEVERAMVPPGAQNFPLHSHAAQWEFYWIESGAGRLRLGERDERPIVAGDFFMCAPGEAHALVNDGTVPLVYWVVADNPPADLVFYPESGKWTAKPGRKVFRSGGRTSPLRLHRHLEGPLLPRHAHA